MNKPISITSIYDNTNTNEPTIDCMTFVLDYQEGSLGEPACLATSYNGVAFSQFSICHDGPHLGDKVEWSNLSDELKRHVIARLE